MRIGSSNDPILGSNPTENLRVPGAAKSTGAPLPSDLALENQKSKAPSAKRHLVKRGLKTDAAGIPSDIEGDKNGDNVGSVSSSIEKQGHLNERDNSKQVALFLEDKQDLHRKVVIVGAILALLCAVSCCIDQYQSRIAPPTEVLWCYGTFLQQLFASITGGEVLTPQELTAMNVSYYAILDRASVTFITAIAGVILALAGTLYQTVFRNPIASPTMLGVSSGISLAQIILVLVFGSMATQMVGFNYLFSYISVGITIALLLFISRLMSGKGRGLQVVNLLIAGTILSQLIGVVVNYVTWNIFDEDMWEVYNTVSEALTVDTGAISLITLVAGCLVAIVPVYLLRFRINVLSFGPEEMRMLGVDPNNLQVVSLLCGTILMVTAQIHTGTVSMLSLVVPHVSRFLFGAEFRKQFWGNLLLGAALLVLCRDIIAFIPFVGGGLPIGTVVSFVVMPVFVWMIATQQRSWE